MEESPAPQQSVREDADTSLIPGTSVAPAPRRNYHKKTKKSDDTLLYTSAFVPGMYNIKNPAGHFLQDESNVDVARQMSLASIRKIKANAEEEKQKLLEEGNEPIAEENALARILIVHPGSRNLRIGRASDFYPHEVPNCIARPANAPNRGHDPPVPGGRSKRVGQDQGDGARKEGNAKRRKGLDGSVAEWKNGDDEGHEAETVDENIAHLRDYLRNRLIQERLATDWREGTRVKAANAKVKPEPLPEHNDPYRIDWTEADGRPFYVGTEALRLPEKAGYKVRYPILHRSLNTRDWISSQLLLDDIATIISESLRTELNILPKDYSTYSTVLIVPDHGDRTYVQEMIKLLLDVFGFKEIAVHQESYCAIFSAGMSSACVVDIGAQQTSIACVDEGLLLTDSRLKLSYGGDDITSALATILQRSNFPYRELDLARSQDWLMMDNLKFKICTLEEHLVANTPWDFFVLKTEGLTQKYVLRTYDENILSPLIFFDTRLIDFAEKKGRGSFRFWNASDDLVTDEINTGYDEVTGAMRACTVHLLPPRPAPIEDTPNVADDIPGSDKSKEGAASGERPTESKPAVSPAPSAEPTRSMAAGSATPTPAPGLDTKASATPIPTVQATLAFPNTTSTPVSEQTIQLLPEHIITEASRSPLDAAIAASISMCGSENKAKVAASSILLIGGGSALKGLGAFLADRLPSLLRRKGFPISDISIVPPPRNLNPRYVAWKGASVMCNLETLNDMWIGKDEWDALGARALRDRYLFF